MTITDTYCGTIYTSPMAKLRHNGGNRRHIPARMAGCACLFVRNYIKISSILGELRAKL